MLEPVHSLEFELPLLPPFDMFLSSRSATALLCGHDRDCLIWSEVGIECWHCRPDLIPVSPPRVILADGGRPPVPPVPIFSMDLSDEDDVDMEELLCHESFSDDEEDEEVIFIREEEGPTAVVRTCSPLRFGFAKR